jgi:hypothetical protein
LFPKRASATPNGDAGKRFILRLQKSLRGRFHSEADFQGDLIMLGLAALDMT